MPNESSPTGVLGDPRTDPRVINGWRAEELLPAGSVSWKPKTPDQLKHYAIWNQDGSSACVAFSKAKQLSIEVFRLTGVWLDFSPASVYQLRHNAPGLGMEIADANEIVNKRGAALEALMKSQMLSESQIMAVRRSKVADLFAAAIAEAVVSYVYVDVALNPIAARLEEGRSVSLLLFANFDEYAKDPVIKHPSLRYEDAEIRHEVVAVDYYVHPTLGKSLYIEDSWGLGGGIGGRRSFSEDFLSKRVILADCFAVFDFEGGVGQRPKYDGTIISLQKCLRFEGLFPTDVPLAESYGPVTKEAVRKFQVKYGISPAAGTFGPVTKAKITSLYP
jgi:hypothetical protein